MSGCDDPDSIVRNHSHTHSLVCVHQAFFDEARRKVVYLEGDELHETCDEGHTHYAKVCLTHEFTKVADPDEDCALRDDCHGHINEDGHLEIHHPPALQDDDIEDSSSQNPGTREHKKENQKGSRKDGGKDCGCKIIAVLKPLT